ncbi:7-deoxyloganetin glucosyltransferase [Selaginella moellendorffii]|uniref:7-deoxyloganetin glucosyltransferase n=1 Tax=Selaginella moellendorffii TaxID=88036 RepID=UPI000D1CA90D|nr:7-deoxyloganetin glucosyltransferase [Selaginella moellendorffii]|eukprot:XP_024526584.1 7-deoxyloganetin glucosyltransferase [Selaginella moellendorffii]
MVERPRVVAVPFPMQGHISPLLQLSYQLAAAGIDITFVNTFRNHERLVGSREVVSKEHSSGVITFMGISDGVAAKAFDGGFNESLNASLVASDEMAKPFEELLWKLDGVSCVISDAYLGWAQAVANRFGVPRVALWTSNVAYSLVNYHLPLLVEKGYLGVKDPSSVGFLDNLVTCVPGVEPIYARDLPTVLRYDSGEDPGFANRIRKIQALKHASWVLVNSFEELESAGVESMRRELGTQNYVTVGPLLVEDTGGRKSLWSEDEACLKWLDSQKPGSVLYISFGSIASIAGAQMRSIVKGLGDTRQPFLWAMRKNLLVPDSDYSERSFQEFMGATKAQGQGLIVEWAPQVKVLQHRALGGHLSHCGWNSVLESMAMGVPILGWPCVAEQTMNCKRIAEDWKIGLRFTTDDAKQQLVSDEEVARVIKKLFCEGEGREIKKRAREFSAIVKTAVSPGGSSHRNLERLVQAIKFGRLGKNSG